MLRLWCSTWPRERGHATRRRKRPARLHPCRLPEWLTDMHASCKMIHMRTTLNVDEKLLARARRLSGIQEKTALVRAGLEALIARESAKRLAALGGSAKSLGRIPRRRVAKTR